MSEDDDWLNLWSFSVIEENFQIAPVNTSLILGHDGVVACSPPLSTPVAIVTWFNDGAEITPNDKFSVADNGSLLISPVEHSDAGDYSCQARNELLAITRTSDTIHISVHGKQGLANLVVGIIKRNVCLLL